MNSISVLKKSFSWKFGYPKFQRKVKLQYEKDGEDVSWQPGSAPPAADVCWDFDQQGQHSDSDSDLDSDSEVANPVRGFPESECSSSCSSIGGEDPYSSVASPTSIPIYENQPRDEEAPVYENADVQEPVYHNWSSPVSDCDEHIYEHVNPAAPVNVFLALLQGRADAISPDPNIYEVPPGAILHHSNTEYIENLTTSLTPPEGFQDYENLSWNKQQKIDVSEEEILSLPVEAIYSTVVKPKRRKSRPTITAMLHKEPEVTAPNTTTKQLNTAPAESHTMDEGVDKPDNTVYENTNCYSNVAKCNGNVVVADETVATQQKEGEPQTEVIYSNELDCSNEYENVMVSGNGTCIDIAAPKDENKNENLQSPEDSTQECLSTKNESSVSEDVRHEEEVTELAPVIEISDDGTWETKALPEAEVEQVKQQVKDQPEDTTEFLARSDQTPESVKIKHVALAYGSQYYVNCPVASVKPMQSLEHEQPSSASKLKKTVDGENVDEDGDTRPNIGAQIMKQYDQERQKAKESRNLPDVSLLDVDASLEDIQRERRRIIESQAVRAKRIDSWIKNGKPVEEMFEDALNMISIPSTTDCWITSADLITDVSLDEKAENSCELKTATELEVCVADEDPTFDKKISDPATGEVVYDSILQNKHKTKSYWEQLMMAAATSDQPKTQYHTKRDLLSLGSDAEDGKPNSDVSEQEYFDAQSQISLHSPSEPVDSLDIKENGLVPKIVETVAKKLMENESVVEREIRLQREREATLVREREEAMQRARALMQPYSTTPAETKIAMELREMREREDELRRLRQQLSSTKETGDTIGTDDGLNSIPNTDEGNFSEYGSEEKELSLDETNSRMVSPEVPTGGGFSHQRTESLDSMSSGHSSGSGEFYPNRRRIVVKPLDEPEEEVPSYMRIQKETPIEREIRLAREREEELRREKGIPPSSTTPNASALKQDVAARRITNNMLNSNDSRSVQHRLATSRIQQEINEATEREKELRAAGTIQTTSEDTVDSKVTRFTDLAEYAIEERERRLQKSVSTSNIPTSVSTETDGGIATVPPQPPRKFVTTPTFTNRSATLRPANVTPNSVISPKKFSPSVGQKGLMQRFLASHGKVMAINSTKSPGSSPQVASSPLPSPSYTPPVVPRKTMDATPTLERQVSEGDSSSHIPIRRGYQSAEEKIQAELQEMQKREEELRLQRAHMFAQSQPNLLFIGADDDEHEDDSNHMNGDLEKPSGLRSVLSNPNFLDSEDNSPMAEKESSLDKPSHRNARKRNALIAEWENRIQQNIDH